VQVDSQGCGAAAEPWEVALEARLTRVAFLGLGESGEQGVMDAESEEL